MTSFKSKLFTSFYLASFFLSSNFSYAACEEESLREDVNFSKTEFKEDEQEEGVEEELQCSICLKLMTKKSSHYGQINCGHCFHWFCLARWRRTCFKNARQRDFGEKLRFSCPLCRAEITNWKSENQFNLEIKRDETSIDDEGFTTVKKTKKTNSWAHAKRLYSDYKNQEEQGIFQFISSEDLLFCQGVTSDFYFLLPFRNFPYLLNQE